MTTPVDRSGHGRRSAPGEAYPVQPRRWSLRARLIALVVATAAIALVAVNIVLPLVVRTAAIDAKDATLAAVISAISRSRVNAQDLSDLSNLAQLRGEIGWSTVSDSGISQVQVPTISDAGANPDLSDNMDWLLEAVTVPDSTDANKRYRAQGVPFRSPRATGTWSPGCRSAMSTRPSSASSWWNCWSRPGCWSCSG